jgi:hypothetical protein
MQHSVMLPFDLHLDLLEFPICLIVFGLIIDEVIIFICQISL